MIGVIGVIGHDDEGHEAAAPDLRMVLLGASAWAGGLLAVLGTPWLVVSGAAAAVLAGACVRRGRRPPWLLGGCLVAAAAVAASLAVRAEAHRVGPVPRLAEREAVVTVVGRLTTDPRLRHGRHGTYVLARMRVHEVRGRGQVFAHRVPVLVIGDAGWVDLSLGDTVRVVGRLHPPDDAELAGVLTASRDPTVVRPADALLDVAERIRAGIRDAVSGAGKDSRALIPALVVGDDRSMSEQVVSDFRATGLTHLTAVSGTNLTLVVGFLVVLARWAGVRARGLMVVGILGVAGFVVLARPEPSVVRAAAMGSVALLGMGANGPRTGARAAGVAVFVLLLVDPWLVVSYGFVLSVLATAGILFLAPSFRDALARWLPRWAAEAVAIPLAAQLACTPVVAVLSGQVSLVAVAANLLAAPAVAPATVLGLLGGLAMLAVAPVGAALGWLAAGAGSWIIAVATQLARLPAAAIDWSTGPVSLLVLVGLCLLVASQAGRVLRSRTSTALGCLVLAVAVLRPLPTPGWPPEGWLLVACDVGQGDALVLDAGRGRAVVVDAGPDPRAVDRCLDRLAVRRVPVVVISHIHADHVDGLPGVLDGRAVREVLVTGLRDPAAGALRVDHWARAAGATVRVPAYAETGRLGAVTFQVLGPPDPVPPVEGEGSAANNASLVVIADVRGVRVLLTGDIEPEAQDALRRAVPDLGVDVLKVPHHGSSHQDPELVSGLGARVAVISAGEDNDYGHPAPETVALLEDAGMLVRSTHRVGDVAVVLRSGKLRVVTRE